MIIVSGPCPQNIFRPQRKGDVGYDLALQNTAWIAPGTCKYIPTGVRLGFPKDVWAEIVGRSSSMGKRGLLVMHSIIDTGYTGIINVGLFNTTREVVEVQAGDRIAQLILRETVYHALNLGLIQETERGDRGFGSTGT